MADKINELIEDYRQRRDALTFLDCNMWVGRTPAPDFFEDFTLPELQQKMQRYHIAGGVVSHFASVHYDVEWGNQQVIDLIQGTGLFAAICLLPDLFYAGGSGRHYLADLAANGARVVRLFPKTHTYALKSWSCGGMFEALSDMRIPVMLWHTEISWSEVHDLCAAYPELPIIVEGAPQKIMYHSRQYYPLLEKFSNFYLEMHNLIAYLSIDEMVKRFGAHPFVFGSNLPMWDPNVTMMGVTHARISQSEKEQLAYNNLRKLMDAVRLP
jgi:hypothetical protein